MLVRLPQHEMALHKGGLAFEESGEFKESFYWCGPRITTFLENYERPDNSEPFTMTNLIAMGNQLWDQRTREGIENLKLNLVKPPLGYTRMGLEMPENPAEGDSYRNTCKNNPRAMMEVILQFLFFFTINFLATAKAFDFIIVSATPDPVSTCQEVCHAK